MTAGDLSEFGRAKDVVRWYVARSQPRRENYAIEHLRNQGYVAHCPTIERPSKKGTIRVPLFPGYLFIRLNLARDGWRSINGTRGIIGLVSFGLRPAAVPTPFSDMLDRMIRHDSSWENPDSFENGDQVRIVGGAFDGTVGEFVRESSSTRVAILIELLSTPQQVWVEGSRLVRV